jgi:uncharacterized protein (TIGR02300 family)
LKSQWGTRRSCLKCQTAFYDMKKNQSVCPRCGKEYTPKDFIKKPLVMLNNDIPDSAEDLKRLVHVKLKDRAIAQSTAESPPPANVDDLLNADGEHSPEDFIKEGLV